MIERNNSDDSNEAKRNSNSKVAKVIHQYNLDGLEDELVEYWAGDATERMSLRELADYFNQELLAQTLRNASVNTLDREVTIRFLEHLQTEFGEKLVVLLDQATYFTAVVIWITSEDEERGISRSTRRQNSPDR